MLKAFDKVSGMEIMRNDVITDFRGNKWAFGSVNQHRNRVNVYVLTEGNSSMGGEFFPSVFPGIEIREI